MTSPPSRPISRDAEARASAPWDSLDNPFRRWRQQADHLEEYLRGEVGGDVSYVVKRRELDEIHRHDILGDLRSRAQRLDRLEARGPERFGASNSRSGGGIDEIEIESD